MGQEEKNQDSWSEYEKLVVSELENLTTKTNEIAKELTQSRQDIQHNGDQITRLFDELDELKVWRKDVSEVASPTHLKELTNEVDDLKTFRTRSTTAWIVVQIIFGILLAVFSYFKAS